VIVGDAELEDRLLPTIRRLVRDNEQRNAMREAMLSLAKPGAARSIARLVVEMASQTAQERN
jgi:UDP-N-acetylglucosamine:LPS N-acetylglucosamine transferase